VTAVIYWYVSRGDISSGGGIRTISKEKDIASLLVSCRTTKGIIIVVQI